VVENSVPRLENASGYLVLENLQCVGSDGKVFEKYDKILVAKDVVRNPDGTHSRFTPYRAIAHFEGKGLFLPSFALSCNILRALYENRDDPEVGKVLMQYKDYGSGWGWHAQNTVVDWGSRKIVHYPHDSDFPEHGGNDNINRTKTRIEKTFNPKKFKSSNLEEALTNPEYNQYLKNLTGLQQPEILVEIGKHFNKTARTWISNSKEVRAAWLGCNYDDFYVNANYGLYDDDAARGVQSA